MRSSSPTRGRRAASVGGWRIATPGARCPSSSARARRSSASSRGGHRTGRIPERAAGYWVDEAERGKGIGRWAVGAIVTEARNGLGLRPPGGGDAREQRAVAAYPRCPRVSSGSASRAPTSRSPASGRTTCSSSASADQGVPAPSPGGSATASTAAAKAAGASGRQVVAGMRDAAVLARAREEARVLRPVRGGEVAVGHAVQGDRRHADRGRCAPGAVRAPRSGRARREAEPVPVGVDDDIHVVRILEGGGGALEVGIREGPLRRIAAPDHPRDLRAVLPEARGARGRSRSTRSTRSRPRGRGRIGRRGGARCPG